jgi:phosphate-selective porin OprO and OprP
MTNRKSGTRAVVLGAAFAALTAGAGSAWADEAREKELENRVKDLEKRLDEVASSVKGGYFTANSDLEARISELERLAADDKGGMSAVFKSGLKMESEDKAFSYQFYGLIQNDWAWHDVDRDLEQGKLTGTGATVGEMNGGTEFRRIRFGAQGAMYGNVRFKSELDFATSGNGSTELADVYMELVNCVFGKIRVGHFDEPFGLDRLTSDKYNTFIERNLISEAFVPGRNTGLMVYDTAMEDRLAWQVGVFRDANNQGNDLANAKAGEYNFTGRICGRPILQDDGNTYLHLGAAVSVRDFSDDTVRFRARPGDHIAQRLVDTGDLANISDGDMIGLEAAYVTGPLTLKAEYATVHGNGDRPDGGGASADDFDFDSWSIEASYWLTGESSQYDKSAGKFDRPKVKKNYGDGDGAGAWQVAVGFDNIDLTDGGYDADKMDMWRVGLNWWLNPNTRVSLNVIQADPDTLDETFRGLVLRFQLDF